MKSSLNVLIPPQNPVGAAEPPAAWIGGKRNLARRICAILAATPHHAYVEPFVGMGGVFLRRRVRPSVEVINDRSGEVVNLFRVLQRFPDALLRDLRWRPAAEAEFYRLKAQDPTGLLDIERAGRFLYLQTLAFGGRAAGQNFGRDSRNANTFNLARVEPRVRALHDRLAGVVIDNLDWADCVGRYDADGTLFYLDPPYWGCEDDYGAGMFSRSDFARLADALRQARARFLLSINDRPEVRDLFAWAEIEPVSVTYTIAKASADAAPELLIGRGVDLAPAAAQATLL